MRTQTTPGARGAVHSAEIEYALGNLDLMKDVYPWTDADYKVSKLMQEYFANFIKKSNPNGPGLPEWPALSSGRVMRLDVQPRAEIDNTRARYLFLDQPPK
jgi:para-nitrobenzyl esterase